MNNIDCRKCKHYQVTWDQHRPHQCQRFSFRSSRLPCQVVKESSGRDFEGFSPKNVPTKHAGEAKRSGGFDIKI